ncbi:MAG TPA: Rne/Rng family ribonuclease, partial [Pyrinomonadaceae bacterium]|nr:Rne/Rng family ribonuclease [Pyrinomonadaceae bacterium]
RGGRRRGGGNGGSGGGGNRGNRPPQQARSGPTEDRYEGSKMDETISSAENEFADAEMIENTAGSNGGSIGGGGYQQGGSGNRRETRRERERNQPTITDLLREGQEILVQIAKEPIARKGARITSHIALPGRYLVYMPTIEHVGVSRKIESGGERNRLRTLIQNIRNEEDVPSGGFIVRTAGIGVPEANLREDARYLVRTWKDIKKTAEKSKSPALVHQDLDIIQRILRDQLSDDFTAIRVDSEEEYLRIVEFINRIQPRMVNRVKLYVRDEPILEAFNVQEEIDKALKPRVWLRSGGYLVINQTEALVAIDVNTGKFVGKGNARLEDTITKTNMEAVEEISRQIRLRDLGGIIVLDLIDMEDRRNRQKVLQALQEHLSYDKSPTKVLSFNDFGLIIMTRKRVKQSLERTLCAPCAHCQGAGWVKSPQTVCYTILEEARRLAKHADDARLVTLRVHPDVVKALRTEEKVVMEEIEAYLGPIDVTSDPTVHEEQFDFAFI